MGSFIIKSKIDTAIKRPSKNPLLEISFLGAGGAFDPGIGNSSCIIKTHFGNILIDCGSLVYQKLLYLSEAENIDYAFITHCHEDHIGSLSTFVYHKAYVSKKNLKIETTDAVGLKLNNYLFDVCNHPKETVEINTNEGNLYKDLNMIITKVDTTNNHYSGMPSAGFVFNFKKKGEDVFILYSGDINVPFISIIKEKHPELYIKLVFDPDNVFIFHEATAMEYPPHYPHCEFQKIIEETFPTFKNVFTYHHSEEEFEQMNTFQSKERKKCEEMMKNFEKELSEKLELLDTDVEREKLKEMVSEKREQIKQKIIQCDKQPRLRSVVSLGMEFVVEEKIGLK